MDQLTKLCWLCWLPMVQQFITMLNGLAHVTYLLLFDGTAIPRPLWPVAPSR
jgi:fatty-acid desaturase